MTVVLVLLTIVVFLTADEIVQRVRLSRAKVAVRAVQFPAIALPEGVQLAMNHMWFKQDQGVTTLGVDEFVSRLVGKAQAVLLPVIGGSPTPDPVSIRLADGDRSLRIPVPFRGRVLEVNPAVLREPSLVHDDPYGTGWLVKMKADSGINFRRHSVKRRQVRTWLRSEFDAVKQLILGEMPQASLATLQDGGVPEDGILKFCDAPIWKHCEERFFAASKTEAAGDRQ
jgi:glycine cleavage system H protein